MNWDKVRFWVLAAGVLLVTVALAMIGINNRNKPKRGRPPKPEPGTIEHARQFNPKNNPKLRDEPVQDADFEEVEEVEESGKTPEEVLTEIEENGDKEESKS